MPCIVLVGGGIGCGKTTIINYFLKHKDIFILSSIYENSDDVAVTEVNSDEIMRKSDVELFTIHFDNLCSIKEQEQLMKTLRGWRDFRVDLLMAAERLISLACDSENCIAGPLSERSDKLLEKLNSFIDINKNNFSKAIIIIEDNFYYRSMRYDWFQIARRNNLGFATIFLHCSLNTAVQRNSTRGYHIPEDRIKKLLSCIEYPDPLKYKWEKYSVMFDTSSELSNSALIGVVDVIKEAVKHPAELVISEDKIEAQKICSKSVIHQADKILRKILSKKITRLKAVNTEEDSLRTIVPNLVNIRQKLLLDIKHGEVHLPQDLVEKIQLLGIESVLEAYEESLENLFNVAVSDMSLECSINFDDLRIVG